MNSFLILIAIIIVSCVLLNNASLRIGMPMLLAFIMLGMLFGNNGIVHINLDVESRAMVGDICTVALIFIIFYGGFGTSWKSARPIAIEAGILASAGVILTAGITGLCCHFLLKWSWIESLLMGSVLSSTDAASVFSILRSRKLGLKNNTAPLLELESGSNDPFSYMLMVILLSLAKGDLSVGHTIWQFVAQIGFGLIFGILIALVAARVLRKISFATSGFDSLFLIAVALVSYALPALVGGNGYLSAYIVGIVLGNQSFAGKKTMVHFFDGITGLMQVLIFFMLGLLAHPDQLGHCILPALVIFLVMLLLARPLAVLSILIPFRKYGIGQLALVSFSGLRGAASIVFAILATTSGVAFDTDIFNVVFCVVLISIALQGTLLPKVASFMGMIDPNADVMKTFSDFSEEVNLQFSEIRIRDDSPWLGKMVMEIGFPDDLLLCMLNRRDGTRVLPNGRTQFREGDSVIVCSKSYDDKYQQLMIKRFTVEKGSKWNGVRVSELPATRSQLILIQRDNKTIIPHGNSQILAGDVLYINQSV